LTDVFVLVDDDVVGLDVGVHHAGALEVAQRGEQLPRVHAHGRNVDADRLAKLVHQRAQIHRQRLEYHHRVAAVLAARQQLHAVAPLLGVVGGKPLEHGNLDRRRLATSSRWSESA
jgi:hypothetical protein